MANMIKNSNLALSNESNVTTVFENEEFGKIRTAVINGEPYFCGKDVATALGYAEATRAVTDHVDEDERAKYTLIDSMGRNQDAYFVNESGLYSEHRPYGYAITKTRVFYDTEGEAHTRIHLYWTQRGRLKIYELMKNDGILPLIEREV